MSNKIRRYASARIDVTYDAKRCIHAAECVRRLPAVFDTQKRPWVQPEKADADDVATVVERCPSGALHYERKDGGAAEPIHSQNVATPAIDGPLYVSGNIRIESEEGELVFEDTRLALCRCGASANKPFCDRSHLQIGFRDSGETRVSQEATEVVAEHGLLTIKATPNGPLRLRGNFEVRGSDGQTHFRGSKALLCRCGMSGNKPFCDATHKRIGFSDQEIEVS